MSVCDWKTSHKLKSLGVPQFIATGQHEHDGCQCRFLVMERFDTDLQKMFEKSGKRFPTTTVFLLGLQLVSLTNSCLILVSLFNIHSFIYSFIT